jgi:Domain of unknown function (DUF4190)
MALALSCSCSAAFEVEDTFAGQAVACPDCGAALKVPPLRPPQLRTSGYAIASVVVALVGAFTVVGTALAAVLGVVALASIARHRERLSGAGYAVLGIVLGSSLTAVNLFAFSRGELFDRLREQASAGQVDKRGPMEIVRPRDGYAITRPSRAWGVATPEYAREMDAGDELLLANLAKDAYLQVMYRDAGRQTLDQYRDEFLDGYRQDQPGGRKNLQDLMRFTDFHLREVKRLPPLNGAEVAEALFDVKHSGQNLTFRVRFVKPKAGTDVYAIVVWTHRRRLEEIAPEVQEMLDSFRLVADG